MCLINKKIVVKFKVAWAVFYRNNNRTDTVFFSYFSKIILNYRTGAASKKVS